MALEDASFFNLPDHQQTVLFFRSGHLIDFYYLPWRDFARELHERYQRQITSERSRLAMPELPANAPIVFLCHENRDKPRAESLAEQLQARGIRIWLDKQSLRGGDRWSILIHDVLEKQSHYVVVLQSPRMLDKPESYFFLEIDLALKRLSKFKPGLRYLIPTILEPDPCLPLPNLAHLHMIDLTAPGGVDDLARDIREDWQERQAVGGT